MTARTDIAVIGAGVIGLACALRLAQEGHAVTLIDPADPGSGASFGNAGTIADYAVMPVGTPGVLRNLPSLLFDRASPLSIRRAAIPALAPWLLRFLWQSRPAAAERNARALATLLDGAAAQWQALASEVAGTSLVQQRGCLYLYETEAARRGAEADLAFRQTLGITLEMIDADALAAMEPGLPPLPGGAAFFPKAIFLSDPGRMMAHISRAALRAGVEPVRARIEALERVPVGVLLRGPGFLRSFRRVVIAAGARSRPLAAMAGDRVPLDTERGYHVEWDMDAPPVTRPSCPTTRGFYLCPMEGRLRVAGTVELGGTEAPPSPHRVAKLVDGARALFPGLGEPARDWMGLRPSIPDSLPVIGPSRGGADVIHAYGHGHIGLTLAPRTAAIVADLVAGRDPGLDLAPVLPGRF
jgi:D-hydroxyproline dehydrogenase